MFAVGAVAAGEAVTAEPGAAEVGGELSAASVGLTTMVGPGGLAASRLSLAGASPVLAQGKSLSSVCDFASTADGLDASWGAAGGNSSVFGSALLVDVSASFAGLTSDATVAVLATGPCLVTPALGAVEGLTAARVTPPSPGCA